MYEFSSWFSAKVDDKGRVVIPAPFKSPKGEEADRRYVLSKSINGNCLEMDPYPVWVKKKDNLKSRLDDFNPEHKLIMRAFMQGVAIVEADPKVGRITIPRHMMEEIGVQREIVFSGVDEYIEVWAKEVFDTQGKPEQQFSTLVKSIL